MMELDDKDLHLEWCSECQQRVLGICRHTPNRSSDNELRTHRTRGSLSAEKGHISDNDGSQSESGTSQHLPRKLARRRHYV
uniref:Uncharacterized protein n=1 Tax=Moniliophthora roreri TaxID=221103 RepID=A0A0W0FYT9_MONRR